VLIFWLLSLNLWITEDVHSRSEYYSAVRSVSQQFIFLIVGYCSNLVLSRRSIPTNRGAGSARLWSDTELTYLSRNGLEHFSLVVTSVVEPESVSSNP